MGSREGVLNLQLPQSPSLPLFSLSSDLLILHSFCAFFFFLILLFAQLTHRSLGPLPQGLIHPCAWWTQEEGEAGSNSDPVSKSACLNCRDPTDIPSCCPSPPAWSESLGRPEKQEMDGEEVHPLAGRCSFIIQKHFAYCPPKKVKQNGQAPRRITKNKINVYIYSKI